MGLNNIEKKSIGYDLLNIWVKFWHNKVYYSNYSIKGVQNIPFDKPLIFAPNHQNALMDAIALLFSIKNQLVFVARADIFKKPVIAKILYFLKILPIYRVRDGYDTIKKNQDIIKKTIDIITSGTGMVILPEGNHSGFRRLRPLKKGFARIAFQTEEANNYNLDIQIVPVGIDYDHFYKYRGSLIINFGKPIPVREYTELYKENNAVAINSIKDRLSQSIAPLMVDIKSIDNYQLYDELRIIYRSRMAAKLGINEDVDSNRITIDKQLIKKVSEFEIINPEATSMLQQDVINYIELRNKLGLTNELINRKGISLFKLIFKSLSLIALLPLFLFGLINNILPYRIPIWLSNKMKDEQFRSSFKFVISLLAFPLFYIIQSAAIQLFLNNWNITLTYIVLLPVSATITWVWFKTFTCILSGWSYKLKSIFKTGVISEIQGLYDRIIDQTNKITS